MILYVRNRESYFLDVSYGKEESHLFGSHLWRVIKYDRNYNIPNQRRQIPLLRKINLGSTVTKKETISCIFLAEKRRASFGPDL